VVTWISLFEIQLFKFSVRGEIRRILLQSVAHTFSRCNLLYSAGIGGFCSLHDITYSCKVRSNCGHQSPRNRKLCSFVIRKYNYTVNKTCVYESDL
jgi:hypothetical protein